MKKHFGIWLSGFVALMASISAATAAAGPVIASYTVAGTPGDYDLEFTVTNNLDAWPTLDVYYFGVELSQTNITGIPAGYQDFSFISPYSNQAYGGSATTYNNLWIDFSFSGLFPGDSLSGFKVHIADLQAPTSVNFFAWAFDPIGQVEYTGLGNFNEGDVNDPTGSNPGFEGTALLQASAVPEPSTLGLTGIGWLCLLALRRHRRRQTVA